MRIETDANGVKTVIELSDEEKKRLRSIFKKCRDSVIPSTRDLIKEEIALLKANSNIFDKIKHTSEFIIELRDKAWKKYLQCEVQAFRDVIMLLLDGDYLPREILSSVFERLEVSGMESIETLHSTINLIGDFSSRITPYYYELSKSLTQSRRSRAGKEFEHIIAALMELLDFPYVDQSSIGKKSFEAKGLGKIVDGILPSVESYQSNRSKCLIVTMKTSLRERWQEVVEELHRTNVPSIHLLTLDENITQKNLETMKNHNITLVTYEWVQRKLVDNTNIISFEQFFNKEIPHILDWWKSNAQL